MKRLSIIGLGKLGLTMATLFAAKGFKVIGVEINPEVIKAVNQKQSPIYEPGVSQILNSLEQPVTATSDYNYAIQNSEVTFIVVPTPSEKMGDFSTKYVEASAQKIAENLKLKSDFHLIVLTSTVLPGATASLKELLERVSAKKCGVDFGLCYSPEFIALGNVLRGLSNPDFVLIGQSDTESGQMLSWIYSRVCENDPPMVRTNFYNAELGKILLNSYVTMKISFANMMAEMCEKIPEGDVDVLSQILGLDSRIGSKYLSGGLAFGGPCFPRDNRAVVHFASTIGVDAKLPKATDEVNLYQKRRVVEFIKQKVGSGKKVAVLGLTYKPNTDVVEESAALEIAERLSEEMRVSVYDPGIAKAAILGKNIEYANSTQACLKDAEFCILATPWKEFKMLQSEDLVNMRQPVVLDCWRILKGAKEKIDYWAIGCKR